MKSDKNALILYHGSPHKEIRPTYGLGNDNSYMNVLILKNHLWD